jgi:hypothetical protein
MLLSGARFARIFCTGCRSLTSCSPPLRDRLTDVPFLDIREIKTVPYVPRSQPVIERLIGTVRRECPDRMLFWTAADLERKLVEFQQYYNEHRTHTGRAGRPPAPSLDTTDARANLRAYRWQPHCRGLYHTPGAV